MNRLAKIERLFLHDKRPYLWIIIFGFLLYAQILNFGFVYFDDNKLLGDHLRVFQDLGNLPKILTHDFISAVASGYYHRPLLSAALILNAQVFNGQNFWVVHLADVVIHILVVIVLFKFLQKLGTNKMPAFFVSLIFLIHPALGAVVAWFPARNDSLAALFILLASSKFIDYLSNNKARDFFLQILYFALAILSKETATLLPAVLLFYSIVCLKKPIFNKAHWLLVGSGGTIISLLWYARSVALPDSVPFPISAMAKSVYQNLAGVIIYLGKTVLPFNLSTYPILEDSNLIYGLLGLVLLVMAVVVSKTKSLRLVLFGFLWFLIFLLPGFIRPDTLAMSGELLEHRVYIPMLGILIVVSQIDFFKNLNFTKKTATVMVLVLIMLGGLTIRHTQNFQNGLTYWTSAAKTSPHSAFAHKQLGVQYFDRGASEQAESEYRTALALNPGEIFTNYNLGLVNLQKKKFREAELNFRNELAINAFYHDARVNLAVSYYLQGKVDKAISELVGLLEQNPSLLSARENLAIFYFNGKNYEAAQHQLQEITNRGGQLRPELQQILKP